MNKFVVFFLYAALQTLGCTNLSLGYAQAPDRANDTLTLQEVTVTAAKISQKWAQTAKIVTIIPDSVLQNNRQLTVAELLNREVGITIVGANNAGGTNQQLYVRGAAVGYTLILIDGMPLSDPSAPVGSFDLNMFDVSQIKRVEILKGAQSSLYGSDAIAGVINIVTRSNTQGPLQLNINAISGSYLTHRLNITASGRVKQFNYCAQAASRISRGFSDAQDSTQLAGFDRDRFRQDAYRLALSQNLADNKITLGTNAQYAQYYADIDAAAFKDDKDYFVKTKNIFANVYADYSLDKLKLRLQYSYDQIMRTYTDDSTDVPGGAFAKYQFGQYKGSSHFVELYANYLFAHNINLLVGVDWRAISTDQQYLSISDFGLYEEPALSPDSANTQIAAAYLSLTTRPLKNMQVELGGRANFHSLYGSNTTYSLHIAQELFKKRLKLFAGIGSGFRAPSLYQLFSPYGDHALNPEQSRAFDGGLQLFPTQKDHTYLRFTYYNRMVKNIITGLSLLDPPYFKYTNMNRQYDQGIEADAQWRYKKWFLAANYTYATGQITTVTLLPELRDTTYNNLIRRPKHSANLQIAYQIGPKLLLGARARWVGQRTDLFFDENTYATKQIAMPAYTTYDLYLRTPLLPYIAVFADVRNLLNKKYSDIAGYNTKGFNFDIGVSLNVSK